MNENNSNLPVVYKNGLLAKTKGMIPQILDEIKRLGKIAGSGVIFSARTYCNGNRKFSCCSYTVQ